MKRWFVMPVMGLCCLGLSTIVQAQSTSVCPALAIPNEIVQAMIEVESRANPLALGAMIKGTHVAFYPDDRDIARLLLEELLKRSDNVDIGLMQLNYRWHIKGTEIDPMSLLQPSVNVALGCRILGEALAASKTLWEGIGRYHSSTPWRTRRYAMTVLRAALERLAR